MGNHSRGVPHVFASEIARLFRYIGRPELPLEYGVGSDVLELVNREATIPIDLWYDLVELATETSGDPFVCFHFGIASHLDYRDVAGAIRLLVLSSDTVRVAMDRIARYQRYWNAAERYEVEDRDGLFTVRFEPWGPPRPAHVQVAEKFAAQSYRFIRSSVKGSVPLAVRFTHSRRAGSEEIATRLHCEPEFDRPMTEIVFDAAVLDARLPTADSVLFGVLDRQLAERLRDTTAASEFSDRVRKAISDYVHREELTIEQVAQVLNVSERTLQRRLTDAGTTFRDLVDEVRKSRALALLQTGAGARELSFLLGYAEEAGFYRAFRRWTGEPLESWKARIAAR